MHPCPICPKCTGYGVPVGTFMEGITVQRQKKYAWSSRRRIAVDSWPIFSKHRRQGFVLISIRQSPGRLPSTWPFLYIRVQETAYLRKTTWWNVRATHPYGNQRVGVDSCTFAIICTKLQQVCCSRSISISFLLFLKLGIACSTVLHTYIVGIRRSWMHILIQYFVTIREFLVG